MVYPGHIQQNNVDYDDGEIFWMSIWSYDQSQSYVLVLLPFSLYKLYRGYKMKKRHFQTTEKFFKEKFETAHAKN